MSYCDGKILEVALVDVSGKGIDAGTRALLLSGAFGGLLGSVPRDEFLPACNAFLRRGAVSEGFVTAVHLSLDLATGEYVVASAGHPPAVHYDGSSGRWRLTRARGIVLGVVPDLHGAAAETEHGMLQRGDALMLYTDGLVEAPGRDIDVGTDRLLGEAERLLSAGFKAGAPALVAAMQREIRRLRRLRPSPPTGAPDPAPSSAPPPSAHPTPPLPSSAPDLPGLLRRGGQLPHHHPRPHHHPARTTTPPAPPPRPHHHVPPAPLPPLTPSTPLVTPGMPAPGPPRPGTHRCSIDVGNSDINAPSMSVTGPPRTGLGSTRNTSRHHPPHATVAHQRTGHTHGGCGWPRGCSEPHRLLREGVEGAAGAIGKDGAGGALPAAPAARWRGSAAGRGG